ncbi:NADH-dependent [FeFe] hydrogenase, group A6 [Acidaminobacter hydrogenoformans]|uniref:NAD(P)-dependent iron-only hydrogenase catalytic subunit n=1 Tax=Acidaminobacter hydrogenoformans DSM 2784 TaxID=1120920 RepID=A0A1G5S1Y2_9FIRM|nr:NADH-dependent [FeFe] hydrogenase, group A6 [Acidaminobacter hydrogenoformans]SCZ80147.1 NAD(P)-dependent iron-only hydrogenase catalytic subunit [Acidaminobacter hydrogenoformans DSM 2784]
MTANQVTLTIDHKRISVPEGTTILEAAKKVAVNIPHLCYHPDQEIKANCRICVVEVKGSRKLSAACSTRVSEGMEVLTNTRKVRDMQRGILELMLANHNQDCLKCHRNGNCELQDLCERFNISRTHLEDAVDALPLDDSNPALVRDSSKCIKCGRCVEACQSVQEVHVLTHSHRSIRFNIAPAYEMPLEETLCVFCGQCAAVCPTGAIVEKDDTELVWTAIEDPSKHVIVQVAPAVRVALGDSFGLPKGEIVTGKTVAALRRLGFDQVFDTNFTADLTIMEESHELIHRLTHGGTLPMVTSCSPGWINYIEGVFDDLLDHLSTCKSPQQMFGALSKTYYAELKGLAPEDIFTVSIMPCTAKKYEAARPEMTSGGVREVDAVLTTRELARMIGSAGIEFADIDEEQFDNPFGLGTGAGAIFGATGGVMEAALRTAYEAVTGKGLPNPDFKEVRGLDGIKEASVVLGDDLVLRVAVANGLSNAKALMAEVRRGESPYHFIEIMACPGGCLGGGGQPIRSTNDIKEKRMDALYKIDQDLPIRKSHKNPDILKLYETWLGEPLGHKSHELLHTHYHKRV